MHQLIQTILNPEITTESSIFKLAMSLLIGIVIGYERKRKGQIAGVRTFSLISMGATLSMILSIYVPQEFPAIRSDATRIAAQVVSGIGFLGAGAIIQMKGSVRGLTTAAGIWMIAAIGMAVGAGLYVVSVVAALLVLFVLQQLDRIEHTISLGGETRTISITTSEVVDDINPYRSILDEERITLTNYFIALDYDNRTTKVDLVVLARENTDFTKLLGRLHTVYPTRSMSLSNQVSI